MSEDLSQYTERERAEIVIGACALRFDGYKWAEAQWGKDEVFPQLQGMLGRFTATHRMFPTDAENLALFFYIQRDLRNGDAPFLQEPPQRMGLAGAFLFLELRHVKIPKKWQHKELFPEWMESAAPFSEESAQVVRAYLARRCGV